MKRMSLATSWLLAHLALGTLTGAAASAVVFVLPLYGGAVGLTQWLGLRAHLRRARVWIIASATGGLVGCGFMLVVVVYLWYEETWRFLVACWFVVALSVAVAQGLTLQAESRAALRWWRASCAGVVLQTVAALLVGLLIQAVLALVLMRAAMHAGLLELSAALGGAVGGLMYAATTLPVLNQLIRHAET